MLPYCSSICYWQPGRKLTLKDASAFNFQWVGSGPVFIDIPSFERLKPGEPWQVTGILPIVSISPVTASLQDIPFQPWLRGHIDGIEPEHAGIDVGRRPAAPGVLVDVYLHAGRMSATPTPVETLRAKFERPGLIKN